MYHCSQNVCEEESDMKRNLILRWISEVCNAIRDENEDNLNKYLIPISYHWLLGREEQWVEGVEPLVHHLHCYRMLDMVINISLISFHRVDIPRIINIRLSAIDSFSHWSIRWSVQLSADSRWLHCCSITRYSWNTVSVSGYSNLQYPWESERKWIYLDIWK